MRISDWSSDVCSSDLCHDFRQHDGEQPDHGVRSQWQCTIQRFGVGEHRAHLHRRSEGRPGGAGGTLYNKIGRASCRERVCQYVSISVVAVSLTTKSTYKTET